MQHSAEIYTQAPSGRFYSPFNLQVSQMERLILINLASQDRIYTGFEPQVFDDPQNGKGLMVIAYLKDGRIDIYHQPGVTLEHTNYDMVGKGLAQMYERPMEGAWFEVGPQGVDLQIAFEDKEGRPVSLRVHEGNLRPRKPFALLAPFPSDTQKPPSLPLVQLYDFYFVRRAGTEIEIRIDGQSYTPPNLPVPMDGTGMTFVRYSPDPFIVNWNENYDGPLTALRPGEAGPAAGADSSFIYDLVENTGHLEVAAMRPAAAAAQTGHSLEFTFDPPFPDLAGLADGAGAPGTPVEGRFSILFDAALGRIEGVYAVARRGSQVSIVLQPSGGWLPGIRKWSVRLMFFIVSIFKGWPKTYRWEATLDLSQEGTPHMTSKWSRIARK